MSWLCSESCKISSSLFMGTCSLMRIGSPLCLWAPYVSAATHNIAVMFNHNYTRVSSFLCVIISPAISPSKVVLGFDSSIKHIIISLDKGHIFLELCFPSQISCYILSALILIFATENDCMTNVPWCSARVVVSLRGRKRALFPKQWTSTQDVQQTACGI